MPHEKDKLSTAGGQPVDNDEFITAARAEMKMRAERWAHEPVREPPPPPRLTVAQKRFAADYERHVGPKLLRLVEGYAVMVRLDVYTFGEAWQALWIAAVHYGAAHMHEAARLDLQDWLNTELMLRLDDPVPDGLIAPERLARITGER